MENTILHHCEGCRWTGLIGRHQLDKNRKFYCTSCSHDMTNNNILRYDPENNGFMEPPPECISKLTVTETMLISRACLIGKVFRLTGGQLGYKGHIINIAQDVQALASSLPRLPVEIETFIVCKPGQDINHKQLVVRRNCVLDALRYLKKHNPMYHNIEIDENRLSQLPESGIPEGFKIVHEKEKEKEKKFDEGPNERLLEVEDEVKVSSETFINKVKDCRTEKEKISLAFEDSEGQQIHWVPQGEPLNEFNTPNLFSACFPDLFHNGKGDPTSRDYQNESNLTWSKKIKHLMYFAFQNDDGSYVHPCEGHALFAYASLNIKQRHEILRCSKVFLNNADKYKGMSIADLKEAFKGVDGLNLMKSLNHYTKSVAGSAGFWNEQRKNLEAAIEGKRAPTLFVTCSAADTHWKQLFRVLTGNDEIPSATERYKLLNEHPLICRDFFKRRFTKYFEKLKSILGIEDWWWRYEFQGRGSFHVHALLWLKNDPGILDLVKTALKGHAADVTLSESTTDSGQDTLTQNEKEKLLLLVNEGQEAKQIVEQYYDWIIGAKNP